MKPLETLKPTRPLTASVAVKPAVKPVAPAARKTAPAAVTPPEHLAANPAAAPRETPAAKAPAIQVRVTPAAQKLASAQTVPAQKHSLVKHAPLPPVKILAPKVQAAPQIARVEKEPLRVPVDIQPPVTVPDPPQRTASAVAPAKSDSILGPVIPHLAQMRTVAYSVTQSAVRQSSRGAADAMHAFDDANRPAIVDGIHSP